MNRSSNACREKNVQLRPVRCTMLSCCEKEYEMPLSLPSEIKCYIGASKLTGETDNVFFTICRWQVGGEKPKHREEQLTCPGRLRSFNNSKAYLPGAGDTVIRKAVPPGWGPSIALRSGWPLRSPQMWVTRARNLSVWGSAFALTPE